MEFYIPYIELCNTVIGITVMIWIAVKYRDKLKARCCHLQTYCILIFALLLAYSTINGCIYNLSWSIQQCMEQLWMMLTYLFALGSLTFLYYRLTTIALLVFKQHKIKFSRHFFYKKYSRWKIFLALLSVRIVYLVCYYPGNIDSDSGGCIRAFFSAFTDYAEILGHDTLSNHHPIIHQILYGGALYLGDIVGYQNLGIFILVLIQLSFINLAIVLIAHSLYKRLDNSIVNIMLLIYIVFPIYSLWSIELAKDQLYSCAILFYIWQLLCIVDSDCRYLRNWKNGLFHSVVVFFVIITKNQGIYIVSICSLVLIFAYFRHSFWIAATYTMAICSFIFLYKGLIWKTLNVTPAGRQEAMGFMYQQSARYAKLFPEEVEEKERKAIDQVIPYHLLAERYNPICQDDVKFCSREFVGEYVPEESYNQYKCVWLKMGIRRPLVYVESLQNNCYGFFYPFKIYPRMFHHSKDPLKICTEHPDVFHYHQIKMTYQIQRDIKYILPLLSSIPIIGLVFGFPFYLWMVVFSAIILIVKKQWQQSLILLPALLSIAILLVSPANDVYRYMEPIVFAAPVTMALAYLVKKNK